MNRALAAAARLSRPARQRYAADIFETGRSRLRDRLVASAYFAVSTPLWGDLAVDEAHLAPFAAALDALGRRGVAPRRIVDVGTGAGASAAMLADRWPDAQVEGVDNSRRMVRRAAQMHQAPNLVYRRASAVAMPYPSGSLDLVTSLNAIVVPSEMTRVCAPGAHVAVVATWIALRPEDSAWVRRFTDAGLRRVDAGSVGGGSWELFTVEGPARPA